MSADLLYLAICLSCTPILPQPFFDDREREEWTIAHEQATGHGVLYGTVVPGGRVIER